MTDITESELIAAILGAQPQNDGDLPRCEPGAICPAILFWREGLSDRTARRVIRDAMKAGIIAPAQILYYDQWGRSRKVHGYRATGNSSASTSPPEVHR